MGFNLMTPLFWQLRHDKSCPHGAFPAISVPAGGAMPKFGMVFGVSVVFPVSVNKRPLPQPLHLHHSLTSGEISFPGGYSLRLVYCSCDGCLQTGQSSLRGSLASSIISKNDGGRVEKRSRSVSPCV